MAGAIRLGLNKKIHKPNPKNTTKTGLSLQGVVNYLKSDSFLYSQLISTPSSSNSVDSISVDVNLPLSIQDKNAIGSEDYLKSDSYLYAPLLNPLKNTGTQVELKKMMSKTILYTKISTREIPRKNKKDQRKQR